ncbi:MAG TPA: squalene--hopene cyclase [Pirellulales bacterium]|nr:squalene--hopene cyclase [Pirellulales bacterium]
MPHEVREIYDRGLQFLAASQGPNGDWPTVGESGPGVTGLCLMALLASGEDPNFGLYSRNIHAACRAIIVSQDAASGLIGGGVGHANMYHHGFAMLALAEAYGAVDDRSLWADVNARRARSVGEALELAVRAAVTSQKRNPQGAWRYSPNAQDADTSVSGAIFMGLLAARNAGIEVPDESIDQALGFYQRMTSANGFVGYAAGMGGPGESTARSSIGTLVFAIARRKDLAQYKAALDHIKTQARDASGQWEEYTCYYQAQALFQGDPEAWEAWNQQQVRRLKAAQQSDGSFQSGFGPAYGTSMSLLVLALNYRYLPIYER